jgi:hypothetical protein
MLRHVWEVSCSICSSRYRLPLDGEATHEEAIDQALDHGWMIAQGRAGDVWYCPACAVSRGRMPQDRSYRWYGSSGPQENLEGK